MRAIRYLLRVELRTRWKGWLGLALLVGAAGGAVTATAAGARRTETAHERFRDAQRAADLLAPMECSGDNPEAEEMCARLRSHPFVTESTVVRGYNALVHTVDGRNIEVDPTDNCYSGPGDLSVTADPDDRWGRTINRHRIVAGRAADPARADEVVISETIADRLGLRPGDALLFTFPNTDPVCTEQEILDDYPEQTREMRVVGVQRSPLEIRPASGYYLSSVHLTPAFAREAGPDEFNFFTYVPVRLREGVTVDSLLADLGVAPEDVESISVGELATAVQNGHRPYGAALAVGALVGLLAAIAVCTPAIARRLRLDASEQPVLWSLGATRGALRLAALARAAAIAGMAAAVCVVVAVVLSPLFPIGATARRVEPEPGIQVAPTMVATGALAAAVVVLGASLPSLLLIRTRAASRARARRGVLAGIGASLPVSAWCGIRMAFARATAAGTGIAAITIAVAALVAALTFSGGVQHLLSTPRLVGVNWDVGLLLPEGEGEDEEEEEVDECATAEEVRAFAMERRALADELSARVAQEPAVAGYAPGTIWSAQPYGLPAAIGPERVEAVVFGFDARGAEPSLISGRVPRAADEVLLGPKTLAGAGLDVGDPVEVYGNEGYWCADPRPTSARFRVVGTAALPVQDPKGLGHGALFALDGLQRLNTYAVPDAVWLRLAPGSDAGDLSGLLDGREPREALWDMTEALSPGELAIGRVDGAPLVIAALLGLLGFGVLLHLLVGATARNRRELAVLGALGCTRSQRRGAVRWQAVTVVAVPLGVGIPLGVALGRLVFHEYASRLGAVPEPVTPWAALVLVVPITVLLALLAAVLPARAASQLRAAEVLRAE